MIFSSDMNFQLISFNIEIKLQYNYLSPQMQEVIHSFLNFTVLSTLILFCLVLFIFYNKYQFNKRIHNLRGRTPEEIPSQKIIIAIQPNQFFFKLSHNYKTGWKEVILREENQAGIRSRFTKLFKKRIYYRNICQKSQIINFIQTLSQNSKVQLYLYTCLPLQVAEFILKQLNILTYFPQQFRVCYNGSADNKMHAIDVDSQTNRVVILTGSKSDFEEEYHKYFVVMRKKDKNFSKIAKKMNRLININEEIDQLHNQLAQLKIVIQSESQGGEHY